MNKKFLFALMALFFSFAIVKGQDNVIINLVDNTNVTVPISNIQKITFDSDNLLLKTTDGTVNSYLLDNVASITFLNPTGIHELPETIDVNIYVNSFGEIAVETQRLIRKLTVYDLTGREVASTTQSKLNVNFLNTGIYILLVATDQGLVSKKFSKNR